MISSWFLRFFLWNVKFHYITLIEYFWVCSIFENADILKFLFWWLLQSLKVLRMAFVTNHTTRVVENNYYVVTRKEMGKRAKLLLSLYLLGAFVSRTLYVVIAFGCSSCCQHDEWEFSNPESKPGKHSHHTRTWEEKGF